MPDRSVRTAVGSRVAQQVEQAIGRMTVPVLGSDADDAHGGVELVVQPVALVGGPVVRHLHEVDRAEVGRGEHPRLRTLPEVAEEHGSIRRGVEVDHDAGVVARRGARLRPDDAPVRVAEVAPLTGDDLDRLRAATHERTQHAIGALAVERAVDDRVDPAD